MRKFKENILKILLYLSAIFTVGILVFILGFIFIKGYKEITPTFILSEYSVLCALLQIAIKYVHFVIILTFAR